MSRPLATAVAGLVAALALAACSSDPAPDERPARAGGDVDRVAGQVVDADSLAISPDGDRLAAGCGDRLCVWETDDGTLAATYAGSDGSDVVAWSPDGTTLATSGFSDDGARATVVLLDAGDGHQLRVLDGHQVARAEDAVGVGITDLAFSPDGALLASAGHDGTVRVWPLDDTDGDPTVLTTASADPDALAFSADGSRLAVAGPGASVEVWSVRGKRLGTLDGAGDHEPQGDVAWSPDGTSIATASRPPGSGATVRTWDAADLAETSSDPVAAYRLAWSPDGASLAMTVKDDDAVLLRDTGGDTRRLTGLTDQPRGLVWSPDGTILYAASSSDGVLAWDVSAGSPARKLERPTG